jgi:hypothetical protein
MHPSNPFPSFLSVSLVTDLYSQVELIEHSVPATAAVRVSLAGGLTDVLAKTRLARNIRDVSVMVCGPRHLQPSPFAY